METNNIIEDIRDLTNILRDHIRNGNVDKFMEIEALIQNKLVSMEFILLNDPTMDEPKREEGKKLFGDYKMFLKNIKNYISS